MQENSNKTNKSYIRPISIYLPQFHPIPENDAWWGKGFTEWTNVTKARPLFEGHYQPHLPTDLGFYDLRVPEVREEQAKLAKEYGIYGFCYYHYWFNGRRILERPFEEVFKSGKPDFPFMLCWANENWTRTWDGDEKQNLLEQKYSHRDDVDHIRKLIQYFKDPRYIRIDNKPVFAIYRSENIPDAKQTIDTWRKEASKEGLDLYICRFEGFEKGEEYLKAGFDAAIAFEPISVAGEYLSFTTKKNTSLYQKLLKKFQSEKLEDKGILIDYNNLVDWAISLGNADYKRFPCVSPMWDNSARRKNGFLILKDSSPQKYSEWLRHEIKNFHKPSKNENLIFINAWNEWAEGNHLEPCRKWGLEYLKKTKEVLDEFNSKIDILQSRK